jgi:WD40 repeat protein
MEEFVRRRLAQGSPPAGDEDPPRGHVGPHGDAWGVVNPSASLATAVKPDTPVARCLQLIRGRNMDGVDFNPIFRIPLLLHMLVEVLCHDPARLRSMRTRYDVYQMFVELSLQRDVGRLAAERRVGLGVTADNTGAVVQCMSTLGCLLAGEMWRTGRSVAEFVGGDGVWERVQLEFEKFVVLPKVTALRDSPDFYRKRYFDQVELERIHLAVERAAIQLFPASSVLRVSGGSLEFMHRSVLEYFCAQAVLAAAGSDLPLEERVTCTVAVLGLPDSRRMREEPGVLDFLGDQLHEKCGETNDCASRTRECLFAIIEASAAGVASGGGRAPANAATILNWAGVSFAGRAWDGVVLEGADLTRANFSGASLMRAHLAGCRLAKANLCDADFTGADFTSVDFGELAPMDVPAPVTCCTWHSEVPGILAVCSVDGAVQQLRAGYTQRGSAAATTSPRPLPTVATHRVLGMQFLSTAEGGDVMHCAPERHAVQAWDVTNSRFCGAPTRGHRSAVPCMAHCAGHDSNLWVGADVNGCVWSWTGDAHRQVLRSGDGRAVTAIACSPCMPGLVQVVAVGYAAGPVELMELAARAPTRITIAVPGGCVTSLEFCVRGLGDIVLASGSANGVVHVWDVVTGQRICEPIEGDTAAVTCMSFGVVAPELPPVLACCYRGSTTVRLFDIASCRAQSEPTYGHCSPVTFLLPGLVQQGDRQVKAIFSGSADGTVCLRENNTGHLLGPPLAGLHAFVTCGAFGCEAGDRWAGIVCCGAKDGTVCVWEWDDRSGAFQGTVISALEGQERPVVEVVISEDSSGPLLQVWFESGGYQEWERVRPGLWWQFRPSSTEHAAMDLERELMSDSADDAIAVVQPLSVSNQRTDSAITNQALAVRTFLSTRWYSEAEPGAGRTVIVAGDSTGGVRKWVEQTGEQLWSARPAAQRLDAQGLKLGTSAAGLTALNLALLRKSGCSDAGTLLQSVPVSAFVKEKGLPIVHFAQSTPHCLVARRNSTKHPSESAVRPL